MGPESFNQIPCDDRISSLNPSVIWIKVHFLLDIWSTGLHLDDPIPAVLSAISSNINTF
jgi:hypothetical protein